MTATVEQREIVATVREWVEDARCTRVASEYEHADEFPTPLVEEMKELGLFGVTIPEEYGGLGLDLLTYALIQIELSRGWMSLSGVLNTHFISAWMIETHGTDGAARALPAADGDRRAAVRVLDDGAARGLGRPGDPHPRRPRRATSSRSRARRCGRRTGCGPARSCCSPSPTRTPSRAIAA